MRYRSQAPVNTLLIGLLMFGGNIVSGCSTTNTIKPVESLQLETRHTSVFNRINYRIPDGWVVIDGESDWIASSADKQFWAPGFDPELDAYYVVSVIFPHLTMDDMSARRVRTLEELVTATSHALSVASSAEFSAPAERLRINNNDALAIASDLNGSHVHHQIFIQLNRETIATVAGHGPKNQSARIKALVGAIAETVKK